MHVRNSRFCLGVEGKVKPKMCLRMERYQRLHEAENSGLPLIHAFLGKKVWIREAREIFRKRYGREGTVREIAELLGIDKMIVSRYDVLSNVVSSDTTCKPINVEPEIAAKVKQQKDKDEHKPSLLILKDEDSFHFVVRGNWIAISEVKK